MNTFRRADLHDYWEKPPVSFHKMTPFGKNSSFNIDWGFLFIILLHKYVYIQNRINESTDENKGAK